MDISKFQESTFNIYAEAVEILSNSSSVSSNFEALSELESTLDKDVAFSIQNNHCQISKYLSNLKESEHLIIDYIAYIKSLRKELNQCKRSLLSEPIDPRSIWLKKLYLKQILQGLRELRQLRQNQDTVQSMIKEKLYDKAGETISQTIEKVQSSEFKHLPIYKALLQNGENTAQKLSEIVLDELKSLMFLRSPSLEIDFKKYFVSGLMNVSYFFSENSLREFKDISLTLPSILNSLNLSGALNTIRNNYTTDIQNEVLGLFSDSFSQLASRESQSRESYRDFSLESIQPSSQSKEVCLMICNGITVLSAMVIQNHFMLAKKLKEFGVSLSVQPVYEAIQREVKSILNTLAMAPTFDLGASLSIDILGTILKDENPYSHLIETLVPLSPYNLPYFYLSLEHNIKSFEKALAATELMDSLWYGNIDDHSSSFFEILKGDTWKLYLSCVSTAESFRYNKNNMYVFPAVSVFEVNMKILEHFANTFSGCHSSLLQIVASMLYLLEKEVKNLFEKQSTSSAFNELFMQIEENFHDLRADPVFQSCRLWHSDSSFEEYFILKTEEYKGIYHDLREQFITYKTIPWNSFIVESSKLAFFAVLASNLERVFKSSINFAVQFIDKISSEMEVDSPVQNSDSSKPVKQKKSFKALIRGFNKKKRFSDVMLEEGDDPANSVEISTTKFRRFIRDVQYYYDKAMILLKGEIEVRIFKYLFNLQNRVYFREIESANAEEFIGDLISDIKKIYLETKPILSEEKLSYIWEGVFERICTMFIYGLREAAEANFSKAGLGIFIKNVNIVESELVNLDIPGGTQRSAFKRLNEYLELLYLNEKALLRYINANPQKFTVDEYEIMAKVKVPSRAYGFSSQSIQILNGLLLAKISIN